MDVKWCVMIVFLFMIPFCSSTIIFYGSFDDVYNVGDNFYVNFSVEALRDYTDFVEASLSCDNSDFIFHKNYYSFSEDEKRFFSSEFPLSVSGDCVVEVSFDEESKKSLEFEISDNIKVAADVNSLVFSPGESVVVNGSAVKENGELLDGYVEISFLDETRKVVEVEDGVFSASFVLGNNVLAGTHKLKIRAVEENYLGEEINSGSYELEVSVKSTPSKISVDSESVFSPPYNLSFGASLYDQGGAFLGNQSIVVKLFDVSRNIVYEGSLKSGEDSSYVFSRDAAKGRWDLNFYYGNVFANFPLYVGENSEVEVSVSGNSILVKNVGNVFYGGIVSVDVNNGTYNDKIDINVNLSVGESFSYPLSLIGYYNLSVGDKNFDNVYLTGASVFFDGDFDLKSFVMAFVILGVLGFSYLIFRKKKFIFGFLKKNKIKKSREGKKNTLHKVRGENSAYIVFLKFDKYIGVVEKFLEKYGFSYKNLGEGLIYVMFTSKDVSSASKLLEFSREVKRFFDERGSGISIVLHSGKFRNKVSLLKRFALLARRLIRYSGGKILLTREFCDRLGGIFREFNVVRIEGVEVEFVLL